MTQRPPLVHLAPICPAPAGNGLAMRTWLFTESATRDFEVHVAVVPVAGRTSLVASSARITTITVPAGRPPAKTLLADPLWRTRLAAGAPLPGLARRATPLLVDELVQTVAAPAGTPVHVTRGYLAPLGLALAERLDAPWVTLDLDDDDEALARALGDSEEADAWARLVRTFGPAFDAVALASADEAAALSARHGLATVAVPNAVAVPQLPASCRRRDGVLRLLFVGNLTYRPNVDAARALVADVLPQVRDAVDRPVAVTLVGNPAEEVRALSEAGGVVVTGQVPDLGPHYGAADVVVVPLTAGGGTRIKLLEAFAHGIPVVSTPIGAAGLAVRPGEHLLLGDTPADLADQVARLAADRALAARLAAAAHVLVESSYSLNAVIPQVQRFFRGAHRSSRRGG